MTTPASSTRAIWALLLSAGALLAITMGARMSLGLFVQPLAADTGTGIVAISLALAIGQLVWGLVQPLFGAVADQRGPRGVLMLGGLLMAAGLALATQFTGAIGMAICLGVLTSAGAGAGAFSVLIGATARQLPAERRSFAAGFINAGGSAGQLLFAPLVQAGIAAFGWVTAMLALAASTLATIPLAGRIAPPSTAAPDAPAAVTAAGSGLRAQLDLALRDRSYLLLNLGFFTCGVHVAFLVTHLPGEVALCGLSGAVAANALALVGAFNIAGSLGAGWLGQRYRFKHILGAMYLSRAVLIALYLLSPRDATSVYLFAAGLGFTFLATVPPTAGLVGKLFGPRYLGTLFGLAVFSHQIGGFFGAWLGGVTISRFGDFGWMWIADMMLALLAALTCLPLREARPAPPPLAAAAT
jgi:predicted MFS family arabinose efflux permease